MIDILGYMLPDQAWALENHLETSGAAPLPLYTIVSGKMLWDLKGAGGFPWDGNSFDEQYIYQSITENIWTNASSFKMFASKTWPNANGGVVWAPRYFTPGASNPPIVTADSTYRTYSACGAFTTSTLGGPVATQIEGPYDIDFGGTIGTQSAIVQKYFWGWGVSGYANMEVNYFVIGLGHVQWELHTLVKGVYILQQISAFNSAVEGGVPALMFPCGVPVI
jgi:hypothetical protein